MILKNLKFYVAFSSLSLIILTSSVQSSQIRWIKPVDGTVPNPFGHGYNFYGFYRAGHTGMDIKAKIGTPVHAVDDGVVKFIKTKRNMRYGNYIVIQHPSGLCSLYGHLSKVLVKLNQQVKQNDIVAATGVSGLASFPHLHFEVTDRVPVRDGAWGYNYICKVRKTINVSEKEKTLELTKEIYDFVPLPIIKDKFNFMDKSYKQETHFYRMKKNHCIEETISPITYYNPEQFMPKFERSEMPNFNRYIVAHKPKDREKTKDREKVINSKLNLNHTD